VKSTTYSQAKPNLGDQGTTKAPPRQGQAGTPKLNWSLHQLTNKLLGLPNEEYMKAVRAIMKTGKSRETAERLLRMKTNAS